MAFAGTAVADPSDGPFANEAAVRAFWQGVPVGGAGVRVFLDGQIFTSHLGFSPPAMKQYFHCTNDIRPQCPDIEAGAGTSAYLQTTFGAGRNVFLDGTLIQSGSVGELDIKTCFAAARYFVVQVRTAGSSVLYAGGDCF